MATLHRGDNDDDDNDNDDDDDNNNNNNNNNNITLLLTLFRRERPKIQCWARSGKFITCYNEWICMRVGMFKVPSATGCTEDRVAVPWQSF